MTLIPDLKSAAEIAQIISAVAVGLGVWIAVRTIHNNRQIQREQTANNAYIKYIELAFHNPEFATPNWAKIDLDEKNFGLADDPEEQKKEKFERYCWFVSIMMNTANFVFTEVPQHHVLQRLMILQIAYHWKYIDYFKGRRKHLAYRYDQHKNQIDEGIRLKKEEV
jgi:hypothetical protein